MTSEAAAFPLVLSWANLGIPSMSQLTTDEASTRLSLFYSWDNYLTCRTKASMPKHSH